MAEFKLPTETVDLPSKGKLYSKDSPLSEGQVEMKYMTAKEEDILSNQSYIADGIVIDKLLKSLIVTKFNYDDLLIGDKNALMIAARMLGYGKDYKFKYGGVDQELDLTSLSPKPLHEDVENATENKFTITLPASKAVLEYKMTTHGDERKIDAEIKGYSKINKKDIPLVTTRLKHQIISVNGETEKSKISEFIDSYLLAQDARALRNHIKERTPDVDLTFFPEGRDEKADLPIGISFFWPDI